jgi:hypothetical protein
VDLTQEVREELMMHAPPGSADGVPTFCCDKLGLHIQFTEMTFA